jgi:hypothetical protein
MCQLAKTKWLLISHVYDKLLVMRERERERERENMGPQQDIQ